MVAVYFNSFARLEFTKLDEKSISTFLGGGYI